MNCKTSNCTGVVGYKKEQLCKNCYQREWGNNNPKKQILYKDAHRAYSKNWYLKNRSLTLERAKAFYERHKEDVREYKHAYCINNRVAIREKRKSYYKDRASHDLVFKLGTTVRTRIKQAIKNGYKGSTSLIYLGTDIDSYRKYIEGLFQDGMSWANWSMFGWHIDHIKPICMFDLTREDQMMEAFNYKNTQPMWWADNLRKGNRYE